MDFKSYSTQDLASLRAITADLQNKADLLHLFSHSSTSEVVRLEVQNGSLTGSVRSLIDLVAANEVNPPIIAVCPAELFALEHDRLPNSWLIVATISGAFEAAKFESAVHVAKLAGAATIEISSENTRDNHELQYQIEITRELDMEPVVSIDSRECASKVLKTDARIILTREELLPRKNGLVWRASAKVESIATLNQPLVETESCPIPKIRKIYIRAQA